MKIDQKIYISNNQETNKSDFELFKLKVNAQKLAKIMQNLNCLIFYRHHRSKVHANVK